MFGGGVRNLTEIFLRSVDASTREFFVFVFSLSRHLRPSALSTLTRPSVLITDAHNTLTDVMSRKYREGRLIATVMDTVRGGGNVLMPTDTAGELLYTSDLFCEGYPFARSSLMLMLLLPAVF